MTRPRPSIGPALAGAVDLSGLKQPAQSGGAAGNAGAPPGVTEITEANFEDEVLVRSTEVPVVVLLWSPRSESCVQLASALAALSLADNSGAAVKWSLALVNVDVAPRVAQVFGVEGVPTVVALAGGKPVASFQGSLPPEQLRGWIDSLVGGPEQPEQVDPVLAQARDQLDAGDFDAARASYQALLDGDPNHVEAKGALRQLNFLERATSRQPDAPARADAAPDDVEAAFAAADVQILNQDVTAAFDRLIALVRRTSGDERAQVRTRLVELFELFDPADPEVVVGRRNLANALY
ncbi:tetratricopeptide repeat protein [Mycolicibacter minnesotensis]